MTTQPPTALPPLVFPHEYANAFVSDIYYPGMIGGLIAIPFVTLAILAWRGYRKPLEDFPIDDTMILVVALLAGSLFWPFVLAAVVFCGLTYGVHTLAQLAGWTFWKRAAVEAMEARRERS